MAHTYREKENGINYYIYCSYNGDSGQYKFIKKYRWVKIFVTYDVDAVSEPFTLTYYKDGITHNEYGPAIITMDGIFNKTESYYIDGKLIQRWNFDKLIRKKKLKKIGV